VSPGLRNRPAAHSIGGPSSPACLRRIRGRTGDVATGSIDSRPAILIIGQTPPPYGGQALMIQELVRADFRTIRTYHVRMGFSDSMSALGRIGVRKILHLLTVVTRALHLRFRHKIRVLYYPPAGPTPAAILRDVVLLLVLRPFFRRVIFHFHAVGVSDYFRSKPATLRLLTRAAYGRPDAAIQNSVLAADDVAFFRARRVSIIANGLPDAAPPDYAGSDTSATARVLFVGAISEVKGTMLLLEAARQLAAGRSDFSVRFMGEFISRSYERKVREFCRENGLDGVVSFLGLRVDGAKWEVFRDSDILCLPSFLESFGNVLVEGMMFRLPVVATPVGGAPDIIVHEVTGLLSDHSPSALAGALERLIADRGLREAMGRAGRERYLERFTLKKHLARMEAALRDVAAD
jgi:glycosyltransferase involved in cell wall biosynthesis